MPYSKAQMKASNKYRAKAYEQIQVSVFKGKRNEYKAQAAAHGLSLNAYIISLLEADKAATDTVAKSMPHSDTPDTSP